MDNKKNGIPKLRFPGFTGAWEQRKLGEMSHIETGKLDANAMVKNGKYDFYTSGIKKYHIDTPAFKGPAITIAGNGATVGYMHLADGEFNAYQRTYVLTKFSANRSFIFIEIGNKLPRKIQQESRAGNIPYIVMDMLTDLKIVLPSLAEQEKIGNFFNELNSLITLHQRKLEHLQEQKKGLLQKMFPKNGETVPEVRFPGFTDAWEQRKLGEVAMRVTRKNKNLESTLPLTISAQLGLVDQISYFDKRIASSNLTNYILLNRGEFAYNKSYSNGYPFGAVKRLNRYDKGVIPSLYIAFMPNTIFINSDFMEMYFETSLWHKEVSARASEGARNHGLLNISPSDFMDIYMKIPEKIEEQKKIAKFLEDFDSLIALHQRKLEHLELMKKGLLQQMFV